MSDEDPKRLLEGGGARSGQLRSLLEAGRSEVPSDGQMLMLAAKIGIIGGIGGAGAAGAAGAGGAGGAGAAGGAAGAGAVGGKAAVAAGAVKVGLAVKVIGAVAIVGAAGTGAAVVVSSRQHVETPAPVGLVAAETASVRGSASASASANVSASANANANANAEVEVEAGAMASALATGARNVPRIASAEPRDEGPEAEVKLVERAQKARGTAEALALCNDHARRFPNGMLTQECEVIAIEALVKTGRNDEARKRANRFKARFPGSSGIRRIDVLLGD